MSTHPWCTHALRCMLQVGNAHTMRIYTTSNVQPNANEKVTTTLHLYAANMKLHEIQYTSWKTTCTSHFLNELDTLPRRLLFKPMAPIITLANNTTTRPCTFVVRATCCHPSHLPPPLQCKRMRINSIELVLQKANATCNRDQRRTTTNRTPSLFSLPSVCLHDVRSTSHFAS